MDNPLIWIGILAVVIVVGVLIYRSTRGPKVPEVNPFDAVRPSRSPNFPADERSTTPAALVSSTAGSDSAEEAAEEEPEPEEEMTIANYLAQAEQEEKDGEFDSAIDSIGEAITLAQTESGGDSLAVAKLLLQQGRLYQLRDYEEDSDGLNCAEYLRAMAIVQQNLGPNAEELLPILQALVSWYYQNGEADKADQLIRRSQSITDFIANTKREAEVGGAATPNVVRVSPIKVPFTSTDADAVTACKEGDEAFASGDFDAAVESYCEAISSVQTEIGRDAPELALLFHRLGRAYQVSQASDLDEDGKPYTDPADNYQIALGMVVVRSGFNAPEVEQLLLDLASFEDLSGEHYKAESYLRRLSDVERIKR